LLGDQGTAVTHEPWSECRNGYEFVPILDGSERPQGRVTELTWRELIVTKKARIGLELPTPHKLD